MSGGITVKEFKHIPGVNDAEYIRLLEEYRKIDRDIINKAVAKIKRLSAELRERPEIVMCEKCKHKGLCFREVAMANECLTTTIYERINFCSKGEENEQGY